MPEKKNKSSGEKGLHTEREKDGQTHRRRKKTPIDSKTNRLVITGERKDGSRKGGRDSCQSLTTGRKKSGGDLLRKRELPGEKTLSAYSKTKKLRRQGREVRSSPKEGKNEETTSGGQSSKTDLGVTTKQEEKYWIPISKPFLSTLESGISSRMREGKRQDALAAERLVEKNIEFRGGRSPSSGGKVDYFLPAPRKKFPLVCQKIEKILFLRKGTECPGKGGRWSAPGGKAAGSRESVLSQGKRNLNFSRGREGGGEGVQEPGRSPRKKRPTSAKGKARAATAAK